jgi:DNA polymerase III subunit beta
MKITCDRDKLLAAFQTAASVAPPRSPKPILQNVKLDVTSDSAILMATDLEIGIRLEVPGIQIEVPGSAVLPIGRFGSILRESADEKLYLETEDQGTVVRGERSEFRLPGENPAEYPDVADFTPTEYHELPATLFREMIRRTVFATESESSRYALGGVLLEMTADKMTAVGTDGRRLARMEGPAQSVGGHGTGDNTTIVPSRAMQLLERALAGIDAPIQISARSNDILLRSQRTTFYSRLVEGRYPKWRDVFPVRDRAIRITLNVGPFFSAVRQAAIVTSEESRGVEFTFGGGKAILAGRAAERGQSHVELPIAYDEQPVSIVLDPRFVGDFLKVLNPEKTFTLEMKDADSAAVCLTDDGYGYVIMPLSRDR